MGKFTGIGFGLALALVGHPALATSIEAVIVSTCGAASLTAGNASQVQMDITGKLCDNGGGGGGSVTITGTLPPYGIIPAFKVDQTTPGTTNGVQINAALPAGTNSIGKAQGQAKASGATTDLISCDSSVIYDASTNGKTQLVGLTSSQNTYVCGFTVFAAGTVNVSLSTGTGTNCGTTSTNITPAFQLTAQTGAVDGSPFFRGLKTAASEELCLVTSAGVAVQAIVYYTKF